MTVGDLSGRSRGGIRGTAGRGVHGEVAGELADGNEPILEASVDHVPTRPE